MQDHSDLAQCLAARSAKQLEVQMPFQASVTISEIRAHPRAVMAGGGTTKVKKVHMKWCMACNFTRRGSYWHTLM